MGWMFIGNTIVNRRGGGSWQTYWSSLISVTVENAAPTNVVLTFPTAKPALGASDFTVTVNGSAVAVSSASWTGAVLTLVLASAVLYEKVVVVTFARTGETATVTNNVDADTNAATFITATGVTDATSKAALNELVIDLKAINDTQANFVNFDTPANSVLRAVYPLLGATAASQKWNLIDQRDEDAAFRIVWANDTAGAHTANGYKPNGSNQIGNTKLIPSSVLTLNNTHIAIYPTDDGNSATEIDMGCGVVATGNKMYMACRYSNLILGVHCSEETNKFFTSSNLTAPGLHVSTRLTNNNLNHHQSGVKLGTITKTNTYNLPNNEMYIGGYNATDASFASKNYGFASIGAGITDAANVLYEKAVRKYLIALGRISLSKLLFKYRDFSSLTRYSGNPIIPHNAGEWNAWGADTPYVNSSNKIGDTYYCLTQAAPASLDWRHLALYTSVNLLAWNPYDSNPIVLERTEGGTDDSMIAHPCVIKIGTTWYCYYSGTDSSSKETIHLATSPDFINWTKQGVVYSTDGNAASACVIQVGETYYMYYYYGAKNIAYATSADGLTWTYGGLCFPASTGMWYDSYSALADVWVIKNSLGIYEMVFSSTGGPVSEQKIGYAISQDGIKWYVLPNYVLEKGAAGTFEAASVGDSVLFEKDNGTCYLFYVGMESAVGESHSAGAVAMIN